MSEAPEQPKRRGRPPLPEDQRTGVFAMRMTAFQRAKLQRLAAAYEAETGASCTDAAWLLWQIDSAPEPGEKKRKR